MFSRIVKILVVVLILLVAAEVAVRLIPGPEASEVPRINTGYPEQLWIADGDLGYAMKPGFEGKWTKPRFMFLFHVDDRGRRKMTVPSTGDKDGVAATPLLQSPLQCREWHIGVVGHISAQGKWL